MVNFHRIDSPEQIQKRMHDLTSTGIKTLQFFEDKWRAYKDYLESTGTNSDSKVHDKIKVVSSFFTRNGLPLNLKKGDWKSTQKQEVIEKKFKLAIDDIKRMYTHANLRDKCLLLILAQSGFSETDISGLKVEQIQGLYDMAVNEHYVIEKPRDKSNHVQATCLSYEFLHDLRDLLMERGNPTNGYIFTSQTKEKGIANIDVRRINESMKALFAKTFGEEKGAEFETRSLRSFYNSALLRAKIQPQEVKGLLMGHSRGGARDNYNYDDETIREAYISAFEYLSINGIQSREDLAKIKADLNAIIGKQQVQIEQQKDSMKELNSKIGKQEKEMADQRQILDLIYGSIQEFKTEKTESEKRQDEAIKEMRDSLERQKTNAENLKKIIEAYEKQAKN
jgi:integrase/uncharacterized coiled-coil protein SlyX